MPQQLRYEGSKLDDVLERVRDEHGPDARIVSADLTRSRGIGGFFARETFQVVVELDPEPPAAPTPAVAVAPAVEPAAAVSPPPPPVFTSADEAAEPPREFARLLADLVEDPRPSSVAAAPSAVPAVAVAAAAVAPIAPTPAVPVSVSSAATVDPEDRRHAPVMSESIDRSPVALGDLVAQLDRLVRPAPAVPTAGVVAVVGARAEAVEVAVELARAAGRAASDVLVAAPSDAGVTPRTIGTVVAESARRRARRGDVGPSVVAVVVAPGTDGMSWAVETVAALGPAQVRVAVGGWRPIDRTLQLVERLAAAAPVDALDLIELDGATAPEQFLQLGVPVGTVDGAEAPAAVWAALLVDCGRAAALTEDEIVLAPAPVVEVPAVARGPVPAVFPSVAAPSRRA